MGIHTLKIIRHHSSWGGWSGEGENDALVSHTLGKYGDPELARAIAPAETLLPFVFITKGVRPDGFLSGSNSSETNLRAPPRKNASGCAVPRYFLISFSGRDLFCILHCSQKETKLRRLKIRSSRSLGRVVRRSQGAPVIRSRIYYAATRLPAQHITSAKGDLVVTGSLYPDAFRAILVAPCAEGSEMLL